MTTIKISELPDLPSLNNTTILPVVDGGLNKKITATTIANYIGGLPGNTGATGPRGPQGPTGPQGASGPLGYSGSAGPSGEAGPSGSLGYTGSQGAGFVGSRGDTGFVGSTGGQGFTGSRGAGFTGSQGSQGVQGPQGIQGITGFSGSQGIQGPQGVQGPQGAVGPAGIQGPTGPIGPQGDAGDIGYTGSAGTGYTGSQGSAGPSGDLGYTGSRGQPGVGIRVIGSLDLAADLEFYPTAGLVEGDSLVIVETTHLLVWNTVEWIDVGPIQGPQGLPGNTGFTGSFGAVGFTGSRGAIGFSGSVGPRGFTGSYGDLGYTGSQGVEGLQGPSGEQGPQGVPGPQGSEGPTGPAGATGPEGPQGITGETGYTGSQGDLGYTGSVGAGFTGSIGATGPIGFVGSRGVAGDQGEPGFTGSIGSPGSFQSIEDYIYSGGISTSLVTRTLDGGIANFSFTEDQTPFEEGSATTSYENTVAEVIFSGSFYDLVDVPVDFSNMRGYTGSSGIMGPVGFTGSSGLLAGSDKQIIFNDSGEASGSSDLTFDKNTNTLAITGNITVSGGEWSDYSPSWTASVSNPSIGDGSIVGRFYQFGKTVQVYIKITVGSTTALGSGAWRLSLPISAQNNYNSIFNAVLSDNGSRWYQATAFNGYDANPNYVTLYYSDAPVNDTAPFTWTNGDSFVITGTYEAL